MPEFDEPAVRCRSEQNGVLLSLIVLSAIALTLFMLNLHTPLMMDDYDYSISWATGKPLTGLGDIIRSQAIHYKLWGGRALLHAIAQCFLYVGKPLFNAANTVMYLLLVIEISALAVGVRKALCWQRLLFIHLTLFFVPFFGTVFLWLDGACNYLWGTVLALLPLLGEKERLYQTPHGFIFCVFWNVACLAAGWTNENTALGVLAVRGLWILYKRRTAEAIPLWWVLSLVMETAGVVLLLFAPGNYARSGVLKEDTGLFKRAAIVLFYVSAYSASFFALAAVGAAGSRNKFSLQNNGVWLMAAGLLSGLAMAGSPEFSERTLTGMIALLLSGSLFFINQWISGNPKVKTVFRILAIPAILVLTLCTWNAVGDVKAHEARWNMELSKINNAIRDQKDSVKISSVLSSSRYTMDIRYSEDAQAWPNSTLSAWFGIPVYGD